MLRGMESAKAGLISVLEYNDNVAHSLANANTVGFKQIKLAFKDIQESAIKAISDNNNTNLESSKSLGELSHGSCVDGYTIDFSQGVIKETGRRFDVAVNGEGFFKVQMGNEFVYTRNGTFNLEKDGTLTDMQGHPIFNKVGKIILNTRTAKNTPLDPEKIIIQPNGDIYYEKELRGHIDLFDFANKDLLVDVGENRYVSSNEEINPAVAMKNPNMQQGALEMSNANSVMSLINSMSAQRAYEAISNVLQMSSKTLEGAINRVGKTLT